MEQDDRHERLTKEQKTGFVLLLVFGLVGIGMGFLQMRNTIYHPFAIKAPEEDAPSRVVVDESAHLQAIDTDQDGLSNYEELFFYETSPYLPDTDSDGISDKDEIQDGTNPNCATGKNCDVDPVESVSSTPGTGLVLPSSAETLNILGTSSGSEPTAPTGGIESLSELFNDPIALRALLKQSGQFTEEQLELIDDDTLLDLVDELLGEQQISFDENTDDNGVTSTPQ